MYENLKMNYWRLRSLFANYLFNIIQITVLFVVVITTLITPYYFQLEKSANDFTRRSLIDSLTREFHIGSREFTGASFKKKKQVVIM